WRLVAAAAAGVLVPAAGALAQTSGVEILTVQGTPDGGETWSVSLQVLVFMTALSLLPALLITMTSFTRILIVLAILRQGLGTQQTPSNQLLVGIALFLSFFVMAPVGERIYTEAVEPYLEATISAPSALEAAAAPLRELCSLTRAKRTSRRSHRSRAASRSTAAARSCRSRCSCRLSSRASSRPRSRSASCC